jgi:hypothetical protein
VLASVYGPGRELEAIDVGGSTRSGVLNIGKMLIPPDDGVVGMRSVQAVGQAIPALDLARWPPTSADLLPAGFWGALALRLEELEDLTVGEAGPAVVGRITVGLAIVRVVVVAEQCGRRAPFVLLATGVDHGVARKRQAGRHGDRRSVTRALVALGVLRDVLRRRGAACRSGQVLRSSIRQAMVAIAAAALALSPTPAVANCAFDYRVAFSYPNEGTREVPLDAVFWAVPDDGTVSFRLDGVELERLDDSEEGKFQFVHAQPLSPGMHDIEISTRTFDNQTVETLRLRVNAVEQAPVEADATIEAVRYYPLVDGYVSYPPPEPTEERCGALATVIPGLCNDLIPASLTRIDFSTHGNAIGYLLGRDILPPGCSTHFPYEFSAGQDAPYRIRAILPTGLSAARVFEVDGGVLGSGVAAGIEEQASSEQPAKAPVRAPPRADSCAMHSPANGASPLSLLWFVAAAAVACRLRRR